MPTYRGTFLLFGSKVNNLVINNLLFLFTNFFFSILKSNTRRNVQSINSDSKHHTHAHLNFDLRGPSAVLNT